MSQSPAETTVILTHYEATALLDARKAGRESAEISLDMGLTRTIASLDDAGVALPGDLRVTWEQIAKIKKNDAASFIVQAGSVDKIQLYSPGTRRFYSLRPTDGAPTMLVAGFPMHRMKEVDPREDTLRKIRTVAPITGRVLDTATGLGYTAIEAAKTADLVTTIELDPAALSIARRNPWSRDLFDNPRIEQRIGDTAQVVPTLPDNGFDIILHDPPAMALGGDLYGFAMYRELHRVLRRGGRMYHYIGDPESRTGRVVTKGVVKRLQEAGFVKITRRPEAFGVVCGK